MIATILCTSGTYEDVLSAQYILTPMTDNKKFRAAYITLEHKLLEETLKIAGPLQCGKKILSRYKN